ncbi:MAG: hypothetical protein ABGX27_06890 [Desulfurobacteriaceae bacterium]
MSQDKRRRMKVRIDGRYHEIEVKDSFPKTTSSILRLIEYRYLFPERSIKYVEKDGEVLHPTKIDEVKDLEDLNIITEPSVNMIKKQIELALMALDAMSVSLNQIVRDFETKGELAKLYLNNLLDSLEWTVKVVENGSKILPIYDGLDEAIVRLEDKILKLDDLMYEGNEERTIEVLSKELPAAIEEWKSFLKEMVRFIKSASDEVH